MQFDWMSTTIGILIGAAAGAIGGYITAKCTDQRRKAEQDKQIIALFKNIKKQMPKLTAEFKSDLSKKDNRYIREFLVLPDKTLLLTLTKPRFKYYENEHKNLKNKIVVLENHGFLTDVTSGTIPIYRMTEDFVSLILKHG